MKKLIFTTMMMMVFLIGKTQNVNLQWANKFDGGADGKNLAIDANGNVYTGGYFFGTKDFDPGPGVFELISNPNGQTRYIRKLDSNGNFVWAKSLGTGLDISLIADNSGNVYWTGQIQGTVDVDPSSATYNLTANGFAAICICKIDPLGNFVWAKQIGGDLNSFAYSYSIDLDATGNVYVSGSCGGYIDFDPGVGVYSLGNSGTISPFFFKLTSSGDFGLAKVLPSNWTVGEVHIKIAPNGDIILSGSYSGSLNINPPSTGNLLTSNGGADRFVCKYSANGNFIWGNSYGGFTDDNGGVLAIDANDNIYTIGANESVIKLDPSGNTIWNKLLGVGPNDLTISPNGNIYTTGSFGYYGNTTVDFDPSLNVNNLISNGEVDAFYCKYNLAGDLIWAKNIGGIYYDLGKSIKVDSQENIYTNGYFHNTVDFDFSASVYNLASTYGSIFLQKLSPCLDMNTSIFHTACFSYYWPLNGQTYTVSGTYHSQNGCAIDILNLTILNPVDSAIASNLTFCPGSSVALVGSPAGGTFSGLSNPTSVAGTYTYTYTNSCGVTTNATGTVVESSVAPAVITTPIVTTPTEALVSWTAVPGSTIYYLWYRPVGAPNSAWKTPTTTGTSLTLTGLSPNTTYECAIRNNNASCNQYGVFSALANFTTTNDPCGTATTFNPFVTTSNAVTMSWVALPNVAQYSIWYRLSSDPATATASWHTLTVGGAINSIGPITLPAGTYSAHIRNRCNNATSFSGFGVENNFTIGTPLKPTALNTLSESNFNVFPNPVSQLLNIEFTTTQKSNTLVKLFDMTGRIIKQIQWHAQIGLNKITFEMNDVANGIYTIQVVENNQLIHVSQVRKND